MKTLNYYISLATKGNAEAAYEAAKLMHYEKYNEVIVQSMLRKAANLGNVNAQRWLGFVGLADKLVDPSSTIANIKYISDHHHAYSWFERAASQGDTISAFAVFKCLQHGIGVAKNLEKANALLEAISGDLNYDMLPLMFFFDTYKEYEQKEKTTVKPIEYNHLIKELLAS